MQFHILDKVSHINILKLPKSYFLDGIRLFEGGNIEIHYIMVCEQSARCLVFDKGLVTWSNNCY